VSYDAWKAQAPDNGPEPEHGEEEPMNCTSCGLVGRHELDCSIELERQLEAMANVARMAKRAERAKITNWLRTYGEGAIADNIDNLVHEAEDNELQF
jgi:hypothetical protein